MMDKVFNADMLLLARGTRELTQAEAAAAAGITQAMLSKVENRLSQPSEDVTSALARALHYPVDFFYQTERAQGFPHFHHRKRSKLNAKPLAKIHAIINIQRQHLATLLRSWDKGPAKPIPQIDIDEQAIKPAEVARRMREYWMLPRGPIDNLVAVIEEAGGVVVVDDFGTGLLDAVSFRSPGLPPIFFLNKNVPGDRMRFTLAHELGHMIMHSIPGDDVQMEEDADEFAAHFLMPAIDIRPYLAQPSFARLGRVKLHWKVSIAALIRRCKDLRVISEWQYKSLSIEYSKAGYHRGEPFAIDIEKASLLPRLIEFHMKHLKYSVAEMAKLLLLEEDEFQQRYLPRKGIELVVSNDRPRNR